VIFWYYVLEILKGHSMKILLLDDEVTLLESLKKVLAQLGHESVCVTSPKEAIPLIETGDFDFAFVDFQMDENDGIWFMKNAKIPSNTKVLLMTAHVNRDVINEMFKLGARGYLIKPFSEGEIEQHLDFHE
jgi:two-component system NtrC family sensor kinase